jgi:hypothetical protein
VRDRGAEDRHDSIAGQLVDMSAERFYGAGERGQHAVGDGADPFRVEVLRPRREIRQIPKKYRDDAALRRR